MRYINKNSMIFGTDEFLEDKYSFDLIFKMIENDMSVFMSDNDSYIICRGISNNPTWIWTKDKISRDRVYIIELLLEKYLNDDKIKFVCKSELYNYFLEDGLEFLEDGDCIEFNTLYCKNITEPRKTDGKIDRIKKYELNVVSKYLYDLWKETKNINLESITIGEAINEAIKLGNSECFYVWRNENGKIVSMIFYEVVGDRVKINYVYTPIEERKCGYASNLIYNITKKFIDMGMVVIIYVDKDLYDLEQLCNNIGFLNKEKLINFSCSAIKKKIR